MRSKERMSSTRKQRLKFSYKAKGREDFLEQVTERKVVPPKKFREKWVKRKFGRGRQVPL